MTTASNQQPPELGDKPPAHKGQHTAAHSSSWTEWVSLREICTNLIGIGIVVFVGLVLWQLMMVNNKMADAQTASTFLGPILGVVLGFYFGAASGERMAHQATKEKAAVKQKCDEVMGNCERGVERVINNPAMSEMGEEPRQILETVSRSLDRTRYEIGGM